MPTQLTLCYNAYATVSVPNKIARLLKEDKLKSGDKWGDVYFQWVDGKECKIAADNATECDFKRSNDWDWGDEEAESDEDEAAKEILGGEKAESDEDEAAKKILGGEDAGKEDDVSCSACDEILNNSPWYERNSKPICGACLKVAEEIPRCLTS